MIVSTISLASTETSKGVKAHDINIVVNGILFVKKHSLFNFSFLLLTFFLTVALANTAAFGFLYTCTDVVFVVIIGKRETVCLIVQMSVLNITADI